MWHRRHRLLLLLSTVFCLCVPWFCCADAVDAFINVEKLVTPGHAHVVAIPPPPSPTHSALITVTIAPSEGWTLVAQEPPSSLGWLPMYRHIYAGNPEDGYPKGVFKGKLKPDGERTARQGRGRKPDHSYTVTSQGSPTGYYVHPDDLIVCVGQPAVFRAYRWPDGGSAPAPDNSNWKTNGVAHSTGSSVTFPAGTGAGEYDILGQSRAPDALSDTAKLIVVEAESLLPDVFVIEIDDNDGDPNTRVFVVDISHDESDVVRVTASPFPNISDDLLPGGWVLEGGGGRF
jgi:hypothetical protein